MLFFVFFQTIKDATRRSYGWSYALGWVGMILAAFPATFYSLAGCYITSQRYEVRTPPPVFFFVFLSFTRYTLRAAMETTGALFPDLTC